MRETAPGITISEQVAYKNGVIENIGYVVEATIDTDLEHTLLGRIKFEHRADLVALRDSIDDYIEEQLIRDGSRDQYYASFADDEESEEREESEDDDERDIDEVTGRDAREEAPDIADIAHGK